MLSEWYLLLKSLLMLEYSVEVTRAREGGNVMGFPLSWVWDTSGLVSQACCAVVCTHSKEYTPEDVYWWVSGRRNIAGWKSHRISHAPMSCLSTRRLATTCKDNTHARSNSNQRNSFPRCWQRHGTHQPYCQCNVRCLARTFGSAVHYRLDQCYLITMLILGQTIPRPRDGWTNNIILICRTLLSSDRNIKGDKLTAPR